MDEYDLVVIGGGINGVGIAADAAGRGLKVLLCEQGDLAQGTSSASTKLIHGGLRYLEQYEFRLVREALREREVLLRKAPYLITPLRFVLPHHSELRPAWLLRLGLFLYDHLSPRKYLAGSEMLNLAKHKFGKALKSEYKKAFAYTDCWTDDSRLVIVNAMAAREKGATILTRTKCIDCHRIEDYWQVTLIDAELNKEIIVKTKCVVNAAGPWVSEIQNKYISTSHRVKVKLVKGSHIIVPKMFVGDHAYILQNADSRVVFAIPYLNEYTLIGTTDEDYSGDPKDVKITHQEIDYLCKTVNNYFKINIQASHILQSYSGLRTLADNGDKLSKLSRDYDVRFDQPKGRAPLVTIVSGKLTTYRKLSEYVVNKLEKSFPEQQGPWTAQELLPGSEFASSNLKTYIVTLQDKYSKLPKDLLARYASAYGSNTEKILTGKDSLSDLGEHFGADLYAAELEYSKQNEWCKTAEDFLWRRSKLGFKLNAEEVQKLKDWFIDAEIRNSKDAINNTLGTREVKS